MEDLKYILTQKGMKKKISFVLVPLFVILGLFIIRIIYASGIPSLSSVSSSQSYINSSNEGNFPITVWITSLEPDQDYTSTSVDTTFNIYWNTIYGMEFYHSQTSIRKIEILWTTVWSWNFDFKIFWTDGSGNLNTGDVITTKTFSFTNGMNLELDLWEDISIQANQKYYFILSNPTGNSSNKLVLDGNNGQIFSYPTETYFWYSGWTKMTEFTAPLSGQLELQIDMRAHRNTAKVSVRQNGWEILQIQKVWAYNGDQFETFTGSFSVSSGSLIEFYGTHSAYNAQWKNLLVIKDSTQGISSTTWEGGLTVNNDSIYFNIYSTPSIKYSFDGVNYINVDWLITTRNFTAGEDLLQNDVVRTGTWVIVWEDTSKIYKTDASNSNKLNYIWVVKQNTSSGASAEVETSGTIYSFSGLTNGEKQYLSNTPGQFSTTPWTNNTEFWTASGSTWITIKEWYYNNSEANFTIDLSWESDGSKNIYAKANDGIDDSAPVLLTIEKDTTAPTLSEITPVSTYTNDTTPSYTFNTTETGSISYSGSCSSVTTSANTWNNTISFNTLSEWTYSDCSLQFTDTKGNISTSLSITSFTVDTTAPSEPNIISAWQNAWDTIRINGTCTPETGLKLIVKDNASQVHSETLSSPCTFDYTYTLTNPPLEHDIEYYLEDLAWNKTTVNTFKAYSDSVWYLVTPANGKDVGTLISFFGYATPNTSVKIKETGSGTYIASGTTDNNGIFTMQTDTSQALGSLSVDLEVNGTPKNDIRTINVVANSVIVPRIDESSLSSKYSWVKDIYSFETQIISLQAIWEPLSMYKVYSYTEVSGNNVITEIARWQFSWGGTSSVTSNVALPGGENKIIIIDTVHNVSSNIVYMVIADPFGTVYDSQTKQGIAWAQITFCKEGETTPATLPLLHWEPQPNPVTTDANGYYFSYETVWDRYYICNMVKDGYTFPSTAIPSGTVNLDSTPNVWSHGQVFEIIATPLHIDIPLDKVVQLEETSQGTSWRWGGYSVLRADKTERNYSRIWNRQLMVLAEEGTQTKTRTYQSKFNGWVYAGGIYRVLYEPFVNRTMKRGIELTQPIHIQVTDLDLKNFNAYIRYSDEEEYVLFTDYDLNGNTLSFSTEKGFELKIENNVISEEFVLLEKLKRYDVVYYKPQNLVEYLKFISEMDNKYLEKLESLPDSIILEKIPVILGKISSLKGGKLTEEYKYIYNYLGWLYSKRFDQYEAEETVYISNSL